MQLPHLKGRGRYFSESNRAFKKTFSSSLIEGVQYERNLDTALFICDLAFRRGIPIHRTTEEWYATDISMLL